MPLPRFFPGTQAAEIRECAKSAFGIPAVVHEDWGGARQYIVRVLARALSPVFMQVRGVSRFR
ncbi:hypothetical protein GCM10020254_00860 [Streptomyces goshikiensis]